MTDVWISRPKYFCKYCGSYVYDNQAARSYHENSQKHKNMFALYYQNQKNSAEQASRESRIIKQQLEEIDRAARKSMGYVSLKSFTQIIPEVKGEKRNFEDHLYTGAVAYTEAPFNPRGEESKQIPLTEEDFAKLDIYTEDGNIPAPPSIPPPPVSKPQDGIEFWQRNQMHNPPPENGEQYQKISEFTNRILLGLEVKVEYGSKDWEDAYIVGITETPILHTSIKKITYDILYYNRDKPKNMLPDKIRVLESKLVKCEERLKLFVDNPTNTNVKWVVGDQCQAQYTQDDVWYPAIIYKVSPYGSHATVIYVSYNNTETLPITRLLPVTANPLEVKPAQLEKEEAIDESVESNWETVSTRIITEEEITKTNEQYTEARNDIVGDRLKDTSFIREINKCYDEDEPDALRVYNPFGGNIYRGVDLDKSANLIEEQPKKRLTESNENVTFKKRRIINNEDKS